AGVLDDCEDVHDYGLKLDKARNDLEALDKSLFIPEPMLVARSLNGLRHNPPFTTFLTTFEMSNNLKAIRNATGDITTPGVTFLKTLGAAPNAELRPKLSAPTASPLRRGSRDMFSFLPSLQGTRPQIRRLPYQIPREKEVP
ncbi:hypothetical protein E4U59_006947, partial [Claviceps monticola]